MSALRIFLIVALCFAGGVVFRQAKKSSTSRTSKLPLPAEQSAQQHATRPSDASFSWMKIEAANLVQFRDNLRAIACPDETIEDLIVARVNRQFDERLRDASSVTNVWETHTPLWLTGRSEISLVNRIEEEKVSFLRRTLEIDYLRYKERHTYPASSVEDVREDKRLREFRDSLYGMDVKKEEFDAIYAASKSFSEAFQSLQSDPNRIAKSKALYSGKDEQIKAAIGDERFEEYKKIADFRYRQLKTLSLNGDLNPEAVEQAYELIKINSSDKTGRDEVKKNNAAIQKLIGLHNYLFLLRDAGGPYSFR